MRHWIMAATMDRSGDLLSIERFMPSATFSAPIEMEFAPSGDLYILEYGTLWFQGNDDARLVRVEYNAGNRKPIDRKSTRLNSSHANISYAVFFLKKKTGIVLKTIQFLTRFLAYTRIPGDIPVPKISAATKNVPAATNNAKA